MRRQAEILQQLDEDPIAVANLAALDIQLATKHRRHDIAIVFGSGWDPAAKPLGRPSTILKAEQLPGFLPPKVPGHNGTISSITVGQRSVLVFRGRKHLYEFENGHGMPAVSHYVRVAAATGCKIFIHTNAVGGLRPGLKVGQMVVVSDHNDVITSVPSPLRGAPAFLDCSAVYDKRLRRLCRKIDPQLVEGITANVGGPHFESPAAAKFLRDNGCDIVGMSMIPEAIMARHLNLRFLGLSLVTDAAGDAVTHDEVQDVVKRRAPALGRFLKQLVEQL